MTPTPEDMETAREVIVDAFREDETADLSTSFQRRIAAALAERREKDAGIVEERIAEVERKAEAHNDAGHDQTSHHLWIARNMMEDLPAIIRGEK